ncbi:hypothetical protein [Kribbella endophytica]
MANLKKSSSNATRLKISTLVMRKLMFASGGRCSMTDCGLSLISDSGGWVGTVAHIVGAEPDGPRGAGPMSPEERRSFDNLMLMCATHGREVDAAETGEINFPIAKLRAMKLVHEARISEAVEHAVEEELTGVRTATGLIDISLRNASDASTGDGLAESIGLKDPDELEDLMAALTEAKSRLQRLSQPGLDTLSQILGVWRVHCFDASDGSYYFGDPSGNRPRVPLEKVDNRIKYGAEQTFNNSTQELFSSDLVEIDVNDDENGQEYTFHSPWSFRIKGTRYSFDFWSSAAEFLQSGHGVEIQDWVRSLDFSIFDRRAPKGRDVPWR